MAVQLRFDSAYCFKYSPRPGTVAATTYPDDVSIEEKEERLARLMKVVDGIGEEKAAEHVGSVQEVLVDEIPSKGGLRGKTRGAYSVRVKAPGVESGRILKAKITGHYQRELEAEPV